MRQGISFLTEMASYLLMFLNGCKQGLCLKQHPGSHFSERPGTKVYSPSSWQLRKKLEHKSFALANHQEFLLMPSINTTRVTWDTILSSSNWHIMVESLALKRLKGLVEIATFTSMLTLSSRTLSLDYSNYTSQCWESLLFPYLITQKKPHYQLF